MKGGIKGKQSESKFFTVEFFGVTIIVTVFLMLICLLFGKSVLFEIGEEIQFFILGLFGYFAYPLFITLIAVGFMMLLGKKPTSKRGKRRAWRAFFGIIIFFSLLTVITNLKAPTSFNAYLSNAYGAGRNGISGAVAGGALFSLITFPVVNYLTYVGGIILFSLALLIYFIIIFKKNKKQLNDEVVEGQNNNESSQNNVTPSHTTIHNNYYGYIPDGATQNAQQNMGLQQNLNPQQCFGGQQPPYSQGDFSNQNNFNSQGGFNFGDRYSQMQGDREYTPSPAEITKRDEAMQILYGQNPRTYSQEYSDFKGGRIRFDGQESNSNFSSQNDMISSPINREVDFSNINYQDRTQHNSDISNKFNDLFGGDTSLNFSEATTDDSLNMNNELYSQGDKINGFEEGESVENSQQEETSSNSSSAISNFFKNDTQSSASEDEAKLNIDQSAESQQSLSASDKNLYENMPVNYRYNAPPLSLLKTVDKPDYDYDFEMFKADVKNKILSELKTFKIETNVARVLRGPAVTRFDIEVPTGTKINNITQLEGNLRLRIASASPIRMIAPVPNTSYVGIEVANKKRELVTIKDIVTSDDFVNADSGTVMFALGKDVIGAPVSLNLAKMPHLLVAGTTGSGKSVCLNTLIISLILKYSPQELRFIIVDPKAVEFTLYSKLPHLYFGEIINDDVPLINSMLTWAVGEMNRRYEEFAKNTVRDINSYNRKMKSLGKQILPRMVIIVDEFADVILRDKSNVKNNICLIAQKARAAGMHIVLATQRPSVNIVEGPIKANIPSRIAFRTSSLIDSQTCLDCQGAEKLLGNGDCLYKTGESFGVERVMGAYVSDQEIEDVVNYVKENNDAYFDYNAWTTITSRVNSEVAVDVDSGGSTNSSTTNNGGIDDVTLKAIRLGYDYGGLSTSFLQRKLGVGFPRAARIVDWLENNKFISPVAIGNKKQMLMPKEEFEEKYGTNDDGQE